ncbi:MAG: peptidase M19 [Planctomycetota bacterium]|nr:MAG: peptidase M19 [Planctomycetota bacterium]
MDQPTLCFDAHLDLAWNAIEWNRDLQQPVSQVRAWEANFPDAVPGPCTVSWPELRRGRFGIVIGTLLARLHRSQSPLTFYRTNEAASAACRGQQYYYELLERQGALRVIGSADELRRQRDEWLAATAEDALDDTPIGLIQSMEGAWGILRPADVGEWFERGLRIVGPAHYGPNQYCHGTGSEGGLTAAGRELLREMHQVGMLLDVTHLADQSFWEALDAFPGRVLASHHNCRALVPGDRQLDDRQIEALLQRKAVIGVAFDCWMLSPGWVRKVSSPEDVSMRQVADHIDHICQLAGHCRAVGLGTDLDGGFGKEQTPHDIDTIADVPVRLGEELRRRGYSEEDLRRIFADNWIEFFLDAWS